MLADMMLPLAFLSPSFGEMILIVIIALLLYGSDLPEVARTWGKAYQDFRRHLNGIRNDLNEAIYTEPDSPRRLQFYPEFHNNSSSAEDAAVAKGGTSAPGPVVAEVPPPEPAETVAAAEQPIRHETHGAA